MQYPKKGCRRRSFQGGKNPGAIPGFINENTEISEI